MSELAKVFDGSIIVGLGGGVLVGEHSQVDSLVVNLYGRLPLLESPIPVNSFVSRRVVSALSSVFGILSLRANAKIAASVIKGIVVDVIHCVSLGGIHDETRHLNVVLLAPCSKVGHNVKRFRIGSRQHMPSPLHEHVVVRCINDGDKASRQRNFAVICSGHPQPPLSHLGGLLAQPMPLFYLNMESVQ